MDCATETNWTTVGAPFVYTWCTPCHSPTLTGADRQGAPEGVDFATLADVQGQAAAFEARVFAESGMMPPAAMCALAAIVADIALEVFGYADIASAGGALHRARGGERRYDCVVPILSNAHTRPRRR